MRKIKFNKNFSSNFNSTLNTRVKSYFNNKQLSPFANGWLFIKIIIIYIIYFSLYTLLIFDFVQKQYIILVIMLFGLTSALIGLNVSHDAVHRALFRSSLWNRIFSYSFDMIGMSSYIWKLKHTKHVKRRNTKKRSTKQRTACSPQTQVTSSLPYDPLILPDMHESSTK